ncbi:MAG: hypothetical protein AB7U29_01665 [Desulfobulbus sp.]
MKRIVASISLLSMIWCGTSALAEDAENCKDHPLFSRMPSYEIFNCASREFDVVAFPKPGLKEWATPQDYSDIEGKVVAISYKLKEGATAASSLQIIRNFQNAIKNDSGTILGDYHDNLYPDFPETAAKYLNESPSGTSFDRYTTMALKKGDSEYWVYLCANERNQDYMLLTVEKQEMKQDVNVKK